jgi:hypothetical protein
MVLGPLFVQDHLAPILFAGLHGLGRRRWRCGFLKSFRECGGGILGLSSRRRIGISGTSVLSESSSCG